MSMDHLIVLGRIKRVVLWVLVGIILSRKVSNTLVGVMLRSLIVKLLKVQGVSILPIYLVMVRTYMMSMSIHIYIERRAMVMRNG